MEKINEKKEKPKNQYCLKSFNQNRNTLPKGKNTDRVT